MGAAQVAMSAGPNRPDAANNGFSIAAVERETGLGKDTLRVWERRYGFPAPQRDAIGERSYPADQVDKLRLLKRLLDAGHRPGQVVLLEMNELNAISCKLDVGHKPVADPGLESELEVFLDLLRRHDVESLRRNLAKAQLRMGLAAFIRNLLVPLNTMVGDAWMRGDLQIYQEHLFSEVQQIVLRNALAGLADPGIAQPRVLLATFPGEPHWLGLLMAEALLSVDGARCISLGPQTPVWDIALAAKSCKIDIVALGFSANMNPNQIVEGLAELRRALPHSLVIWAGGSAPALFRRPVAGVKALQNLDAIHGALLDWHRGER